MKKIISTLLVLTFALFSASALTSEQKDETVKALRTSLSQTKSTTDSIKILYDIFDLSPRVDHRAIGKEIYNAAYRTKDYATCMDIARLLTAVCKDDNSYQALIDNVADLPKSTERDETILFLKMRRLATTSRAQSEEDRQKEIARIIAREDDGKNLTEYDRTLDLYSLVAYMRNNANGKLLKKYLDRLIEIANSNKFELYAIKNMIYSEAAQIYSDAGDNQKAIDADHRMLDLIDSLQKKYDAMGRKYRDYDINRYVVYRRMIRNFKTLPAGEAKMYYSKIQDLIARNPEVAADASHNPRLEAYYNMAIGNYNAAIPYLKKHFQKEKSLAERRQILELLQDAARKTGDSKTELEAVTEYNIILQQLNDLNASEKYKELQILYDVKDLKERNSALELENRNEEIKSQRKIMTFVIVAFVVLIGVLVVMMFNWSRFQSNCRKMGNIVNNLSRERTRLRIRRYHDYAFGDDPFDDNYESWQERLKRNNKDKFLVSTFMTESILNDLLYISSIGRADLRKDIQEVSLDALLRETLNLSKQYIHSDLKYDIEFPSHDVTMTTDRSCLVYILTRIMTTADAKSQGRTIHLTSEVNKADNSVKFIFTDPHSKFDNASEQLIFDDYINSKLLATHDTWGLFFCRSISLLIQSDLRYDTTYTEGTRFIFTVPLNINDNLK